MLASANKSFFRIIKSFSAFFGAKNLVIAIINILARIISEGFSAIKPAT